LVLNNFLFPSPINQPQLKLNLIAVILQKYIWLILNISSIPQALA